MLFQGTIFRGSFFRTPTQRALSKKSPAVAQSKIKHGVSEMFSFLSHLHFYVTQKSDQNRTIGGILQISQSISALTPTPELVWMFRN